MVRRIRVGGPEIEATDGRILALGEHPGLGQCRSRAIRVEDAGETDALGVVAAMTERRRVARRRKRIHQPVRREALGR